MRAVYVDNIYQRKVLTEIRLLSYAAQKNTEAKKKKKEMRNIVGWVKRGNFQRPINLCMLPVWPTPAVGNEI